MTLSLAKPKGVGKDRILLLAGLSATGVLATNIILPAFPQMGDDLGLSAPELGLLLSSFFVTVAMDQLIVGPLSDRFGRKMLVVGGLLTFVFGSLVCASAGSLSWLVAGRVIQALGACAASVLARAIARDMFQGETLGKALSFTMIAAATAPGFSPLLGSILVDLAGWRSSFLFVACCAAALAVHYLRRIGETHPAERRHSLAIANVAATYRSLLTDTRFLLPAFVICMVMGGLFSFFAAAPGVMMVQFGLSPLQLGLSFAGTVFIVFAAGLLAPRLAHRHGSRVIGLLGLILFFIGSILMIIIATRPSYIAFTVALTLLLLGMGLVNPLVTAIALEPFGRVAGAASALVGFLQMSCAAIGATLVNSLPLEPSSGLAVVLTGASATAFCAFLPVCLTPPPDQGGLSS